jgi:DNA-binding NtrC family response regulator
MSPASILIVDDEEGIRHGLVNLFRREGFTVRAAADYEEAVSAAARHPLDAAVVDIRLRRGKSGLDLLAELKRLEPDLVVIVITGYGSIDTAVSSLRGGASDYFLKPIDNKKLLDAVTRNLELRDLKSQNRFLKDELSRRCLPHHFITRDPGMMELLQQADKVKDSPVTVLITGESGTGKEVMARYIHFTSRRRDASFVGINCAALSETLLLSELFGHERGAFTGAVERKRGKFELASGGTLFLDEVGDMSLETQAKLLRVIEERSFERVGGVKKISVDVRLIAATNQDLPDLIRRGRFREDLLYRINAVSLHLTPLRERRGDIPLLVEHFLARSEERYGRSAPTLSPATMSALRARAWPGNARELENVVSQIVLLGEQSFAAAAAPSPSIEPAALGAGPPFPEGSASEGPRPQGSLKTTLADIIQRHEGRIIAECLRRNNGNKSRTARELAVTRKTLARKISKYGL